MIKLRYCSFLFLILPMLGGCDNFGDQNKPEFYEEIEAFKEKDRINPPPEKPILLIGSSSVRLWKSAEVVFKDYRVVNRGFGGAKLTDLYRYLGDIILVYNPRQIILYCGDNDIAFDGADAETIFMRFKGVYKELRETLPQVPFIYMSIKPSPGRRQFLAIQMKSNELIKNYLLTQKNAQFLDIFPLMLDSTGKARADIVGIDSIHMNPKGYMIWEKAIRPYLLK